MLEVSENQEHNCKASRIINTVACKFKLAFAEESTVHATLAHEHFLFQHIRVT
jgi:hypothetical protein